MTTQLCLLSDERVRVERERVTTEWRERASGERASGERDRVTNHDVSSFLCCNLFTW